MIRGLAALALLAASALAPAAAEPALFGHADAIDGDTLEVGSLRIRLHGIDAPEADQDCPRAGGGRWRCGDAATKRLAALLAAGPLDCAPRGTDRYRRTVATCRTAGGTDLARALVAAGLAWASPRHNGGYGAVQTTARDLGLGIWQASAEPPWEWRAGARDRAAAPGGCPIKGNITRAGQRIYHTRSSPWYDRTRIDASRGQRWFCDEAQALAAGWRPPRTR